jgi:hypothetical protein
MGVSWDKARSKWAARLGVGRQQHNLGRFDHEIDAAKAYDQAARKMLGDFAHLNFPSAAERERAARYVDRREARRMFGISLPQWKRWEKWGLVRGVKTSYRVFYKVEELEELLRQMTPIQPPYPDPERPGCYRVPLISRGPIRQLDAEAIIDAESLPLVKGRRLHWSGKDAPGIDATGDVSIWMGEEHMALHRVILGIADPELQIGNANGDPLDCRRENLVVRTIQERLWSARKRESCGDGKPCTSIYKGVSWIVRESKWRARIKLDGKEVYLGRFHSEIEAAEAYDEAAREHFGAHARLNFPDESRADERTLAARQRAAA